MSAGEWANPLGDPAPPDDAERTVAVWHPAMSDATYGRLLRLLFDPDPEPSHGPDAGEAA